MYEIIKDVILQGGYSLPDMLKKIDTIWIKNELTDDQRSELVSLAREHADPEDSYAPLQEQIEELFGICNKHGKEIQENSDRITKLDGGTVAPPETEEYPEYKRPTGAHDAYHKGDKMTFKGKKYLCIAPEDVAVVWSPEEYPAYWQLVE